LDILKWRGERQEDDDFAADAAAGAGAANVADDNDNPDQTQAGRSKLIRPGSKDDYTDPVNRNYLQLMVIILMYIKLFDDYDIALFTVSLDV
jgi:hypothetical protein